MSKNKRRRRARYGDRSAVGRSAIAPFKPGEAPESRHARRKKTNLDQGPAIVAAWASRVGVRFRITNDGHHWQFRYADLSVDWWPSTAKLVRNQRFPEGVHVYDYEQAMAIAARHFGKPVATDDDVTAALDGRPPLDESEIRDDEPHDVLETSVAEAFGAERDRVAALVSTSPPRDVVEFDLEVIAEEPNDVPSLARQAATPNPSPAEVVDAAVARAETPLAEFIPGPRPLVAISNVGLRHAVEYAAMKIAERLLTEPKTPSGIEPVVQDVIREELTPMLEGLVGEQFERPLVQYFELEDRIAGSYGDDKGWSPTRTAVETMRRQRRELEEAKERIADLARELQGTQEAFALRVRGPDSPLSVPVVIAALVGLANDPAGRVLLECQAATERRLIDSTEMIGAVAKACAADGPPSFVHPFGGWESWLERAAEFLEPVLQSEAARGATKSKS